MVLRPENHSIRCNYHTFKSIGHITGLSCHEKVLFCIAEKVVTKKCVV